MQSLIERGLNLAQVRGAQYADVRVVQRNLQVIQVKNEAVEGLSEDENQGFGVRVLVNGAWGFAASARLSLSEVDRVAALAIQIARASGRVPGRTPVHLGPPVVHRGAYRTEVQQDPFQVSLEDKVSLLLEAAKAMREQPEVKVATASMEARRERKFFGNSEGAYIEQEIIETGSGLEATAVGHDDVQKRSYPNSFGRHQATMGYELVESLDLIGNAPRVGEEAVRLLTAPVCPSTVTTVILDATQLALQVHESCGHPTELDRVFGTEASYAGTSFLTPDKLGTFRYGSEIVNLTADATVPGGLGTFGFDDEGVPAQKTPLIRDGVFVGYLMSRETAATLGLPSNGCMRADGWNRIPLVRMTNVNLEPGEWEWEDLLADTDEGLYLEMNKSWSIDDRRLNFQFGTEVAREIKGGQLGQLYKNATYTGITPQFWGGCDAICNERYWKVWGTPNCGKGQPGQVMHVGHGTAPARFRNVRVGVMR
ncbi:MAG: TldD/PmbA family protein [Anaerolineae bacterium]